MVHHGLQGISAQRVARRQVSMDWVKTHDLEKWSGSCDSQGTLPDVVRRLIRVSITDIQKIHFPCGDAVIMSGWDGIVIAGESNAYVPLGTSVWECKTSERVKEKATEDYDKRTKDPLGLDPKQTTYVAVTSRKWPDNDQWCEEKNQEHHWQNVCAIDAVDLEDWLRTCPPVGAWLAKRLRLMPQGVQSLEDEWAQWCQSTQPPITEKIPLAGRMKEHQELLRMLDGEPQEIIVRADSVSEAMSFVCAAIESSPPHKEHVFARGIAVYKLEAARQLSAHSGLVIALLQGADAMSGPLRQQRNHVIVPVGNDAIAQRTTIKLPRADRHEFAAALKSMGLSEEESERLALECGRSVTILRRRKHSSHFDAPDWAKMEHHRDIVPALFAGGWDENSESDKQILKDLAGASDYEAIETRLQGWVNAKDPPLRRVGSVWKLSAPVDAFELLARHLTKGDFDHFATAAVKVLSEIDPALDLPPDERVYAGIREKVLKHSAWLRAGIAETILIIAAHGANAEIRSIPDAQRFADDLIRQIFPEKADWRRWGSAQHLLAILAEAAPDPFLEGLERRLEGKAPDLVSLFSEGGVFGSDSPHTGLLWALETLAWDPQLLPRAALILAKLARLDPGGRLANRPIASLQGIFLCWFPNTNATLTQRLAAVDLILEREPNVGWDLLTTLLPVRHGVGHPTAKPQYRELGSSEREAVTWRIMGEGHREVTARLLARLNADPQRWMVLFHALQDLHPDDRQKALELLREQVKQHSFGKNADEIWSTLHRFVNQHRANQHTEWALRNDELDRWEPILALLRPTDPIARNQWLFDNHYPDVPVARKDIKARQEAIQALRQQALKEIITAGGTDGVLQLVDVSKYPELVAWAVPEVISDVDGCLPLLTGNIDGSATRQHFCAVLSAACLERFGPTWRNRLLHTIHNSHWEGDKAALLLKLWPDTPSTWDDVAGLGPETEKLYWERKPALPLLLPPLEAARALQNYLKVKRCIGGLNAVGLEVKGVPGNILVELLNGAITEINEQPADAIHANIGFEIGQVFESLYAAGDVEVGTIARLEFGYLPLLRHHREAPLRLHQLLADDPSLFVDVLKQAFKPASGDEEPELDARAKNKALLSYELLSSWETVPGSQTDGTINEQKMLSWVQRARELAAVVDRVAIGDQMIGRVLAYSTHDSDGAWPHAATR